MTLINTWLRYLISQFLVGDMCSFSLRHWGTQLLQSRFLKTYLIWAIFYETTEVNSVSVMLKIRTHDSERLHSRHKAHVEATRPTVVVWKAAESNWSRCRSENDKNTTICFLSIWLIRMQNKKSIIKRDIETLWNDKNNKKWKRKNQIKKIKLRKKGFP